MIFGSLRGFVSVNRVADWVGSDIATPSWIHKDDYRTYTRLPRSLICVAFPTFALSALTTNLSLFLEEFDVKGDLFSS